VVVTLHPNETYTPAEEAALQDLADKHARLFVQAAGVERYLQNCDYVVTQNSGVGFMGLFFGKPLVLFGKSDFHHIALNVGEIGAQQAIARAPSHEPNYASYMFWFLQMQAINAGRPEAKNKIRNVLRGHGWPV
jgi:capsule polysaccharide export protein KpsC/LpsZ